MSDSRRIESESMRRRQILAASLAGSTTALWGTSAPANPVAIAAGWFFRGAVPGAGTILGQAAMQWLINWWFGQPPGLPGGPPPNWGQWRPPQPGWGPPNVPIPWTPPLAFPTWRPAWPQVAPIPPANFQPPPEFISLWVCEDTAQIYEIRIVGPFFVFSALNDKLPPQFVGGGIVQDWTFMFQALGPQQGPFSVGGANVYIDPAGIHRLFGMTSFPMPTGWAPATSINWRRIR